MTLKNSISKSFFLAEHESLADFARLILSTSATRNSRFTVVCERKEDLKAVRAQLFHLLQQGSPQTYANVVGGISMFTLDNLAQNFVASLANSSKGYVGEALHALFQRPYLDVVTQEQLTRYILLQIGYAGQDALPIAKQVLTFVDVQWPSDSNFLQLLFETQSLENARTVNEITEAALKQIVATYQVSQEVLSKFSRLQDFVLNYLDAEFLVQLRSAISENKLHRDFVVARRILESNVLWVAAPEYHARTKSGFESFYRPGNFQSYIVDILRDRIAEAQSLTAPDALFMNSRTIIPTEAPPETEHVCYEIHNDKHAFFEQMKDALQGSAPTNDETDFYLLADFDLRQLREITSDGSGSYSVADTYIDHYFNVLDGIEAPPPEEGNNDAVRAIVSQLHSHYETFQLCRKIFQREQSFVSELCRSYGLSLPQLSSRFLFQKVTESENIQVGDPHPLSSLDRALSFIATSQIPENIVAIGRPHSNTSPSFHVKILNDAIYVLKKNQVQVEVLASDLMYRGFWSWMSSRGGALKFVLLQRDELEEFPDYLYPEGNARIQVKSPIALHPECTTLEAFVESLSPKPMRDWASRFGWKKAVSNEVGLSVTQFEDFVDCPLSFFLKHVACVNKNETDFTKGRPLEIGIRAHRICEMTLSRFANSFCDASTPLNSALPFLESLVAALKDEAFFISTSHEKWLSGLRNVIENESTLTSSQITNLKMAMEEICEQIFSSNISTDVTPIIMAVETEILKRVFLRLLQCEVKTLRECGSQRFLAFLEHPFEISIGPLRLSGRIDRIDHDTKGFHIFDYKTSKIPKTEKEFVLSPTELTATSKTLSVQAAMYCVAMAQGASVVSDESPRLPVTSFSFYRLKSLDEALSSYVTLGFESPLQSRSELVEKIVEDYHGYAMDIFEGRFSPRPLTPSSCTFCLYKAYCPLQKRNAEVAP